MTRALRSEWLGPRAIAALSAVALVLAAVYPLAFGNLIAVGPLLLAAVLGAWTSHGMCDAIRDRHQDEHDRRRALHRRVNVWVLPPIRVSEDPDVSLLARIYATPDEVSA